MAVEELILRIRGDSKDAQKALQDFKGTLTEAFESPQSAISGLGNLLISKLVQPLGVAAVAGVGAVGMLAAIGAASIKTYEALYGLAEKAAQSGGQLDYLSKQSGINVEALSGLRFAARALGEDVTALTNASFMLQRRLGDGSPQIEQALKKIGLSLADIRGQSADKVLLTISDALRTTENSADRTAGAWGLFGRQGREALGLLMEPLRELTEQAREMGFVWSQEDVDAAHKFETQSAILRMELEHIQIAIGQKLLPILGQFIEWLTKAEAGQAAFSVVLKAGGLAVGMLLGPLLDAAKAYLMLSVGVNTALAGVFLKIGDNKGAAQAIKQAADAQAALDGMGRASDKLADGLAGLGSTTRATGKDIDLHLTPAEERAREMSAALALAHDALSEATTNKLSPAIRQAALALFAHGQSAADVFDLMKTGAPTVGFTAKQFEALYKEFEKGQEAGKKHAEALANIRAAQIPLTAAQQAEVGVLHAQSVSEADIALKIGAKDVQVRKYLETVKTQKTLEEAQQKAWLKLEGEVKKASTDAFQVLTDNLKKELDLRKQRDDDLAKSTERLNEMELTGTALKLAQLDAQREAEIRQAQDLYDIDSEEYQRKTDQINEFYDYQVKLAKGTADTIERRLHDQGIFTRTELAKTAAQAKIDYDAMVATGRYTTDELTTAWIDMLRKQAAATGSFKDQIKVGLYDTLLKVPSMVVSAFTSGGGLAGAAKGVASAVGSVLGASLGKYIGQEIGKTIGSAAGGAVGEAAGAAIGSAMGSVVDLVIKWQTKAGKDAAHTISQTWGVTISEAMKTQLTNAAHTAGDEVAATFQLMAKVIDDTGGVTKKNLAKWTAALHDAFAVATWNAHYSADDLQKTFDDVFPKLTEVVKKEGGIWSKEFQGLIDLAHDFGLDVEQVNSLLNDQVTTIGTGLAPQLAPLTAQYGTLGDQITAQKKVIDDLNAQIGSPEVAKGMLDQAKAVADAQKAVDDLAAAGKEGTDEWRLAVVNLTIAQQGQNQFSKDYQAEVAKLNALQDDQRAGAEASQAALERVGLSALASYNAGIAKGLDQLTLLDELAPALDNLVALEQNLGTESQNAGVQELITLRAKLSANKELAAAATSWGQTYAAMVNLGVTDTDALLAMQQQGVDDYDQLIAKGLTEKQALAQIKGGLQAIYDAHEQNGAVVDENTQKLIDQAKAAGLVKESDLSLGKTFEVVGGKLITVIQDLTKAISTNPIGRSGTSGDAASDAGGPDAQWGELGGSDTSGGRAGFPTFATGGIVQKTQLALVHAGEAIGGVGFMTNALVGALQQVRAWTSPAVTSDLVGAPGAAGANVDTAALVSEIRDLKAALIAKDLSVQIQQAPGSLDTLAQKMMGPIVRTIRRNDSAGLGAGARTVLREALGVA
jgi:hypothetical protein